MFAWITCTAASPAYLANVVQGLVIFNYDTYVPERWHGTLLMWGFILIPVIWNFYFRKMLNTLEMIGGVCHTVFFIISIITLSVCARRSTTEFVFNTLTHDMSGWTDPAVAWGIGLLTVTFPITSFDGVLHMSKNITPGCRAILTSCRRRSQRRTYKGPSFYDHGRHSQQYHAICVHGNANVLHR